MDDQFKEGDVVRAKVGDGTRLVTIEILSENLELATCYWFEQDTRRCAPFELHALRKGSDSQRPEGGDLLD